MNGGALEVFYESSAAWAGGETYFTGNSVLNATGGAMIVDNQSSASWTGKTHFLYNSAAGGGAVSCQGNSSVSWGEAGDPFMNYSSSGSSVGREVTLFVNNSATPPSGGAISSLDEGSRISWSGDTRFLNNTAEAVGGVMSL